jgi:hypothetical protein
MTKSLPLLLSAVLLSGMTLAQNASTPQNEATNRSEQTQVRFAPGTELRAQLDKTIDAKKAKPGEMLEAKTLDDLKSGAQVIAPRGSKIIGHVVAANPHEKDTPSRLEIAFDKLDLGNGSQAPLQATIQALAKPANTVNPGSDNMGAPMGGQSGPMTGGRGMQQPSGMGQPVPSNTGGMGSGAGYPQNAPSGPISPNAQGVEGISGVTLSAGPAHDTVLTSNKHNVKLESGMQLILRTQ